MLQVLTAKKDIRFSFGEMDGSWLACAKDDPMWVVQEHADHYQVVNSQGDEFSVQREDVQSA